MRALIEDLRAAGLRFEEEGPPPGEGPLAGKTFVLTGTLPDLTREQATERISAAGGRVTASCRRRPTTSSPARARARSSRRPSGSASRCSTRPACWRCFEPAEAQPRSERRRPCGPRRRARAGVATPFIEQREGQRVAARAQSRPACDADSVPVFARQAPWAAVPRIRRCSVPVSPGDGSEPRSERRASVGHRMRRAARTTWRAWCGRARQPRAVDERGCMPECWPARGRTTRRARRRSSRAPPNGRRSP